MAEQKLTSIEIGRAALRIAVTENRGAARKRAVGGKRHPQYGGGFWRRVYAEHC